MRSSDGPSGQGPQQHLDADQCRPVAPSLGRDAVLGLQPVRSDTLPRRSPRYSAGVSALRKANDSPQTKEGRRAVLGLLRLPELPRNPDGGSHQGADNAWVVLGEVAVRNNDHPESRRLRPLPVRLADQRLERRDALLDQRRSAVLDLDRAVVAVPQMDDGVAFKAALVPGLAPQG